MVGGNMIATYLKEKNLIICPNSLAKTVTQEISGISNLISYKIMDLHGFLEHYFFSYDKKTIFYLMKKLNIRYEIALEYLESIFFIENKEYHSKKLNELRRIKSELLEKKLFIFHPGFRNYLDNTNVILYGYYAIEPFYQNILETLPYYTKIDIESVPSKHTVYEFSNIEEEIAYICHDIKNKLDNGISIQNIKLLSPTSEYRLPLKRIFHWCHIPIEIDSITSLYDIEVGKKVLDMINHNLSFSNILEAIENINIEADMLNQIVSIFNQYIDFNEETKELFSMIKYDLKHTYLKRDSLQNVVTICNWNTITDKDYIYIMGFNKENYPTIYKDTEFLSDSMKQELGLHDSNLSNIYSIHFLKNRLNQPFHFIITYKNRTNFDVYNPSVLIKEESYTVISNPTISYQISHFYNQMILAQKYDCFYQYGVLDDVIKVLKYNYPDLAYRTYQNQFKGLDKKTYLQDLKQPFTLSYSAIDEYYHCAFRYYVSHILKIKQENLDDFYIDVGTIFHAILSKCFDKNFQFQKEWQEEIKKYSFSFSEFLFLEKLKQELEYDVKILYKQLTYSRFTDALYEKRLSIPVINSKNITIDFVGIIDKISYLREEEHTLVSLIDYKTGNLSIELNNIIYGLGMQLPIYLYLIKRSNLFSNTLITGFYLQKIINKEIKRVPGKRMEELKENLLKLVGYSTDQEEMLRKFDLTYEDSHLINGLKRKKEGFYSYSKVLNSRQMDEIENIVSNKIEEATEDILDAKFFINPKRIDGNTIGCEHCSYRDLCFKTEKDYIELEKHYHLDFLGGEDDA